MHALGVFVLGAVVSPTDPIAATAIMQRLGVPRRIVSIVEGESLVNDGTALVAYRAAVVATVSGVFSIWEAGIAFVLSVTGGKSLDALADRLGARRVHALYPSVDPDVHYPAHLPVWSSDLSFLGSCVPDRMMGLEELFLDLVSNGTQS
jgi:CPA1 family monovalent cation:H+ antiporter